MSYMLPHLHNGWQVDQAILSEEDRVIVFRLAKYILPQVYVCGCKDCILCTQHYIYVIAPTVVLTPLNSPPPFLRGGGVQP